MDRATHASGAVRSFALVGPGRAGTAVALNLVTRGVVPTAVAGRSPDSDSTRRAAAMLGATATEVATAGADADLVLIATPDSAIAAAAAALVPSLRSGALVVHLAGSVPLAALDVVTCARPDVEIGSLHPLQSFPTAELGRDRLPGSYCAVAGSPRVERLALSLGMRPFRLDERARPGYHAAACVASNHLVALLGQVERLAGAVAVPFEAFLPLVRATLDNVERLGPAAALTGPVVRGDLDTVAGHLDAIADAELEAYAVLAREAGRLADLEPAALERVLA